jgi:hypothetical protein
MGEDEPDVIVLKVPDLSGVPLDLVPALLGREEGSPFSSAI